MVTLTAIDNDNIKGIANLAISTRISNTSCTVEKSFSSVHEMDTAKLVLKALTKECSRWLQVSSRVTSTVLLIIKLQTL